MVLRLPFHNNGERLSNFDEWRCLSMMRGLVFQLPEISWRKGVRCVDAWRWSDRTFVEVTSCRKEMPNMHDKLSDKNAQFLKAGKRGVLALFFPISWQWTYETRWALVTAIEKFCCFHHTEHSRRITAVEVWCGDGHFERFEMLPWNYVTKIKKARRKAKRVLF